MSRCGSNCDATLTKVSWGSVSGYASLFSEGVVVDYNITHDDLNLKYSSDGQQVSRTGKQATMIEVTINELRCSDWSRAVYNAWLKDKFECNTLTINDSCCAQIIKVNFATVQPDIASIAVDTNDPVSIVFVGLLDKGSNVAGSINTGPENPLILT